MGKEPNWDRSVYLLQIPSLAEFPLTLPSARVILLVLADLEHVSPDPTTVAQRIFEAGCVYLCTWGSGGRNIHEAAMLLLARREGDDESQGSIVACDLSEESIEQAVAFALIWGEPDPQLATGCDAIVIVLGDAASSAQAITDMALRYLD